MKKFVMDNKEKQWDLDTEDEILERYEALLEKLRERLRQRRKEQEIEAATMFIDRGEPWVKFYGNYDGMHRLAEIEADLR